MGVIAKIINSNIGNKIKAEKSGSLTSAVNNIVGADLFSST